MLGITEMVLMTEEEEMTNKGQNKNCVNILKTNYGSPSPYLCLCRPTIRSSEMRDKKKKKTESVV